MQASKLLDLIKYVQEDLSLIDCLSFPMSVLQALNKTKLMRSKTTLQMEKLQLESIDDLHIVCIGCSSKAEERVMRETLCWYEVALALYHNVNHIHLYLVGPEMSKTEVGVMSSASTANSARDSHSGSHSFRLLQRKMTQHTFRGTSAEFFKTNRALVPLPVPVPVPASEPISETTTAAVSVSVTVNTICIGLNCGFGNFENPGFTKYDLLISWYADLVFLTSLQAMPVIFTCANDYADLDGECSIHAKLLGSQFLAMPSRNAFSCASTFVQDITAPATAAKGGGGGDFSCGNSFWYAIQGTDINRRRKFATNGAGSAGAYKLPPLVTAINTNPVQKYNAMHSILSTFLWKEEDDSDKYEIENCFTVQERRWKLNTFAPAPAPAPAHAHAHASVEQLNVTQFTALAEDASCNFNVLTITCKVPSGISPTDIVAYVDDHGEVVIFEMPIRSGGSSCSAKPNVRHTSVQLKYEVDPATVKAKVNKKKNTFKIVANCV